MTLEVQKIIDSIRRKIRQPDENNSNWGNDEIIGFLNDHLPDICNDVGVGVFSDLITGTGISKYALPHGVQEVIGVFDNGYPMPYSTTKGASITSFADGVANGPYSYTIIGDYIWILPSLGDSSSVEILYKGAPPEIDNEEDTIDLPQHMFLPIVYNISSELMRSIGNAVEADSLFALFQNYTSKAKDIESNRSNPKVRSMGFPPRRR